MGHQIHCRRRDGNYVYRIWSTIVDAYVTDDLNEVELREELMLDFTPREIERGYHEIEIRQRLDRAEERGSSSLIGDRAVDLSGPWKPNVGNPEDD